MKQKSIWQDYFDQLRKIYSILDKQNELYSINAKYDDLNNPSPLYRAVYQIYPANHQQLQNLLKECEKTFFETCTKAGTKKAYLPANFPIFFDSPNVFKMQVHLNKAHASKNYKAGDLLRISVAYNNESEKTRFDELVQSLADKGIEAKIDSSEKFLYLLLNVADLCNVYQCDSIQHRIATGRQIRADYFSYNDKKEIEKSVLKKIGVLLLSPNLNVEVMQSHQRSIRTDALYVKNHPKEIILDIPELYPIGRIYRRYNDKK